MRGCSHLRRGRALEEDLPSSLGLERAADDVTRLTVAQLAQGAVDESRLITATVTSLSVRLVGGGRRLVIGSDAAQEVDVSTGDRLYWYNHPESLGMWDVELTTAVRSPEASARPTVNLN